YSGLSAARAAGMDWLSGTRVPAHETSASGAHARTSTLASERTRVMSVMCARLSFDPIARLVKQGRRCHICEILQTPRPPFAHATPASLPATPSSNAAGAALWVALAVLALARLVLVFDHSMALWGLNVLRFVPATEWLGWALAVLALVPAFG